MPAVTASDLDDMTPEEIEQSLRLVMAYATMRSLVETINALYEFDDRQEIAAGIKDPVLAEYGDYPVDG